MRNLLLAGLLAATTFGASAFDVQSVIPQVKQITASHNGMGRPAFRAPLSVKDNPARLSPKKAQPKVQAKVTEKEGFVMFESFEDWTGESFDWLPEGWTAERKASLESNESWLPYFRAASYFPVAPDGEVYFMIPYGEDQDEWLISPEVQVEDGMQLSYWLSFSTYFLYSMDNVDWGHMNTLAIRS